MSKFLSQIPKIKGLKRPKKRVGRGYGSGKGGHTVGRGQKGQKVRSSVADWFEGGQTPLVRKMPYLSGFTNPNPKKVISFNISDLTGVIEKNSEVSPGLLEKEGLISLKAHEFVKILGRGKLEKQVDFKGFLYSKTAKEKIESAKGKAQ